MELFYSDHFPLPLPEGHRFPMSKYLLLRERVSKAADYEDIRLESSSAATDEQLLLVHTPEYLEKVKNGTLTDLEIRRLGFPWSPNMVTRSRHSTGASIDAGFSAIANGISGNLAGGTHHAFPASGQGYCVFNDACVAIRVLQSKALIENALVIDCDVHQGNGTAAIAKNDETIFSLSMHCDKNYPFQKTSGDKDIELPPKTGDVVYLQLLKKTLSDIGLVFSPDIIFYLAGADPFEGDRLGHLSLTKAGLQRRDEIVFQFGVEFEIPIAFCMAGGYAENVNDIVDIHFNTVTTAADNVKNWSRGDKPSQSATN